MKIICLKGGLGNQIFEYCRFRFLKETSGESISIHYDSRRLKQHGGTLLDRCFDISLPKRSVTIDIAVVFLKMLRSVHVMPRLYDDSRDDCVLIDDYCQNRRFIASARKWLPFHEFRLSEKTAQLLSIIDGEDYPVAVHVRRGDYLIEQNLDDFGLCTTDYYHSAINQILEKHPSARFFLFSDDMTWVKENLHVENAVCVEREQGEPDYIDLFLMTRCRGHIIANSTFSYWGAMLANDEGATNIYPRRWFANPTWTVPDIFPDDWIAL